LPAAPRAAAAINLDRLDRACLDHLAPTAFRDDVDKTGQPRTDHTAKIRLRVIGWAWCSCCFGKTVPNLLVVGIMAVFAISELLLSPIELSVRTKLAPEAFRAQMMALYFFSAGLGTAMSGVLARYHDPAREFGYFGIIGAVANFAGVVVFAIGLWISRLMEGVH